MSTCPLIDSIMSPTLMTWIWWIILPSLILCKGFSDDYSFAEAEQMTGQDEDKLNIKRCLLGITWSRVFTLYSCWAMAQLDYDQLIWINIEFNWCAITSILISAHLQQLNISATLLVMLVLVKNILVDFPPRITTVMYTTTQTFGFSKIRFWKKYLIITKSAFIWSQIQRNRK